MRPLPPIRREVLVQAGPQEAFEVFTARIGDWWPVAAFSVHGAGGSVAFAGGEIVERSAGGEVSVWGTVSRWEPPAAVAFTWHPGRSADRPTEVTVSFAAAGEQTRPGPARRGHQAGHRRGCERRQRLLRRAGAALAGHAPGLSAWCGRSRSGNRIVGRVG